MRTYDFVIALLSVCAAAFSGALLAVWLLASLGEATPQAPAVADVEDVGRDDGGVDDPEPAEDLWAPRETSTTSTIATLADDAPIGDEDEGLK